MFFTGIIPGLLALFIRLKMDESQIWLKKSKEKVISKTPLKDVISDKKQRKRFLLALIVMTGLLYFLLYFYWLYAYFFRKVR